MTICLRRQQAHLAKCWFGVVLTCKTQCADKHLRAARAANASSLYLAVSRSVGLRSHASLRKYPTCCEERSIPSFRPPRGAMGTNSPSACVLRLARVRFARQAPANPQPADRSRKHWTTACPTVVVLPER